MGYPSKKNKQWGGGGGRRVEEMEFPGGLKKYNPETPGVNKKRSGISKYDQQKNTVEFP